MKTIQIQVQSGASWLKVSTVEYDPSRDRTKRIGDTTYFCRAGAVREAYRILTAWLDSHQFIGRKMRVAENAARYGEPVWKLVQRSGM